MPSSTLYANLADGYRLQLSIVQQSQSGNTSKIAWSLAILKGAGDGKHMSGTSFWSVLIDGQYRDGSIGGYDFRGTTTLILGQGTMTITHGSDGRKTISGQAGFDDNNTYGELGDAQIGPGPLLTLDRIATTPGAPIPVATNNPDQITPTSMRYRFGAPADNGGATIDQYQVRYATNSTFTQNLRTITSAGTSTLTDITPGVELFIQSRAHNSKGWGPWSVTKSATPPNISAPTIAVTPASTGLSASVKVTPPSNVSQTGFRVERRVSGTTSPVTTLTFATSPYTATGLAPGIAYQWRAAAMIGTYVGPFSGWLTVVQPKPNTNPGDYFDGSTPAAGGFTYAWDGTPVNNVTSRQMTKDASGWTLYSNADVTAGAYVLYRQTGGRSQARSARLAFNWTPSLPIGVRTGGAIDVQEGIGYWGSVYVQLPERAQRVRARLIWSDGGGNFVANGIWGPEVLVPANAEDWARVTVFDQAPPGVGSGFASIQVADVGSGVGWSAWKGGDYMLLDDAMFTVGELYPYFDGETEDTVEYNYVWTGTANASPSQRTVVPAATVDPFKDPDCAVIPLPPRPPVVPTDCVTETGTWRRYWAIIPPQYILDWLEDLPTLTLKVGAVAVRQVRIRYYQNPNGLDPAVFPADTWLAEQIISYMPKNSTYVLDGVDQTLRGTVTNGESWSNLNHLLFGTDSTPATWPVLQCGSGYLISFDVPLDVPVGDPRISIDLTRRL